MYMHIVHSMCSLHIIINTQSCNVLYTVHCTCACPYYWDWVTLFIRGETPFALYTFGLPRWAASLAQLVERLPSMQNVSGSNPAWGSSFLVVFRCSCFTLPCLIDWVNMYMYMLLYGCRGMIHFTIVTHAYFGPLFPTKPFFPVLATVGFAYWSFSLPPLTSLALTLQVYPLLRLLLTCMCMCTCKLSLT